MTEFDSPLQFARYAMDNERLLLRPIDMQIFGQHIEVILFRSDCWQIEMVVSPGRVLVPMHRHNQVESCDVVIAGSAKVFMAGRSLVFTRPEIITQRMLRIPKGRWHSGESGPSGTVFLSFQRWDSAPSFISDDWESNANTC